VARHAEHADDEDVPRRAESLCDLEPGGNAAARQSKDEHIVASGVLLELLCEQLAGVLTISKAHGARLPVVATKKPRHRLGSFAARAGEANGKRLEGELAMAVCDVCGNDYDKTPSTASSARSRRSPRFARIAAAG
jgi:hypothetical protein